MNLPLPSFAATLAAAMLLAHAPGAAASEQSTCADHRGAFLTGTVTSDPHFQRGHQNLDGVWLSHTVLTLQADQDGKSYQVALDNVFAGDYRKNAAAMPASLAALKAGTRVEVCGAKYTDGTGIHWVHSNCGATPRTAAPDGWIKRLGADGAPGANLERSEAYCRLWD